MYLAHYPQTFGCLWIYRCHQGPLPTRDEAGLKARQRKIREYSFQSLQSTLDEFQASSLNAQFVGAFCDRASAIVTTAVFGFPSNDPVALESVMPNVSLVSTTESSSRVPVKDLLCASPAAQLSVPCVAV